MHKMIVTDRSKKKAIELAHEYGVKIRFVDYLTCAGKADYKRGVLYISMFITDLTQLYGVVLHEIGHVAAYRNQKFTAYHHGKPINKLSHKERIAAARTALMAEIYVDKWAEKEFNKRFPDRKFKKTYRNKADKDWLRKYIRKQYL